MITFIKKYAKFFNNYLGEYFSWKNKPVVRPLINTITGILLLIVIIIPEVLFLYKYIPEVVFLFTFSLILSITTLIILLIVLIMLINELL